MELTHRELEVLLESVRGQHREIGRLRDDLRRNDVLDPAVHDKLYDRERELYKMAIKLTDMLRGTLGEDRRR